MLRLVSDENFTEAIVQGLVRRRPELDLVRSRDEGLGGIDDPALLEWSATHQRILLTHDRQRMAGHAYDRVVQGLPMPGVFVVSTQLGPGQAIEDIMTLVFGCLDDGELNHQVIFVPL